jgi:hypothetical protein
MSTFNENEHPRHDSGQFAPKANTAPQTSLNPIRMVAVEFEHHIQEISNEAGLDAIGPHLIDAAVIQSGYTDDMVDDLRRLIPRITSDHLTDGYEKYVGPAIDDIAERIGEMGLAPTDDWEQKLNAAADGATEGQLMVEVCHIIADRGDLPDPSVLGSLTPEDLEDFYWDTLDYRLQSLGYDLGRA